MIQGDLLRDAGIEQVESHNTEWLKWARDEAAYISAHNGNVTTDHIRRLSNILAYYPHHSNCWGAIFKGKEWKPIGHTKSKIPSNHSRRIRVWVLC